MNERVRDFILEQTGATDITRGKRIQSLWSGYGEIVKLKLQDSSVPNIILKHVQLPTSINHPRGWNSNRSHERKIKSYQIELTWYARYASRTNEHCRVPCHLGSMELDDEFILLLEDLDLAGFPLRKSALTLREVQACLRWLAEFHAQFLGTTPSGLWKIGTYWHLDTRPDEWELMEHLELKKAAHSIDLKLNSASYQTLVHGDAKVANFCFSEDDCVAAVDFQYVGGGCGSKDVAYFLGSCLDEVSCDKWESELLDYYFLELTRAVSNYHPSVDVNALEREWRALFPVAWTDFYRFLNGWMPTHNKIHAYTRRLANEVLAGLDIKRG